MWRWLSSALRRLFGRKKKITGTATLRAQGATLSAAGQQDVFDVGNENELPKEVG